MTLIIKKTSPPPCYRVERIKPLEEWKYLWADSGLVLELFADTFGSSPSINLSHFLGEFHWSKNIIAICLEGHCFHDCIVVKYLHLGLLRRFDELHCAMCLTENKVYGYCSRKMLLLLSLLCSIFNTSSDGSSPVESLTNSLYPWGSVSTF